MTTQVNYYYPIYMLRLSTKGQYGVRAMFEIAKGYPDRPVSIKDISERQEVSVSYLEQILKPLRRSPPAWTHWRVATGWTGA